MEEWRQIAVCPLYEVSNHGRVRRIRHKAFYLNEWGYPTVQLWKGNSRYKSSLIHRLVAEAFIPNPQNLPEVNHKDGNKLNFAVENLEWTTRTENRRHAARIGLHIVGKGEKSPSHKLTKSQVEEIHFLAGKMTQRKIAKLYGVTQHCISCIVRGKTWTDMPWDRSLKDRYVGNSGRFQLGWREKKGEKVSNAKLTEDQVREIRRLGDTEPYQRIAARFGISKVTVGMILRRKTWTHI